jgi:hypothetical protein
MRVVAAMRKEHTMTMKRVLTLGLVALTAAAALAIGGAEAAGFFKEATEFDDEGNGTEIASLRRSMPNGRTGFFKEATGFEYESNEIASVRRSVPNGRTDIIKAMGNTKWGDIELKRSTS